MGENLSFSQSVGKSMMTKTTTPVSWSNNWTYLEKDTFLHLNFSHPSRELQMIDRKSLEMREKTNCSGTRLTAKHGRVPAWWEAVKC